MAVLASAVEWEWIWVVDSDIIIIIMVGQDSEVEDLGALEAASEDQVGVVDLDIMEVVSGVLVVASEVPAAVVDLVVLVGDTAEALVDGKQAHLSKDELIHSLNSTQTQEVAKKAMKPPDN